MIKKTGGLMLLLFACFSGSYCQLTDTILTTRLTPYLINYLETPESLYAINHSQQGLFKPTDTKLQYRPQYLLKMNHRAYLFFYGSGAVYESISLSTKDSLLRFKRIDNTFNTDYHRGCYWFTHGGRLYNYGGYGFWKSNGTCRVFNFKNREWDVLPLSEEIVPPVFPFTVLWQDLENGNIHVPFQLNINAGIKGDEYYKGKLDPKSHVMDLQHSIWKEHGVASKNAIAMLTNTFNVVQCKQGCWVIKDGNLYLFNFKANRVFQMKDPIITQSFIKIPSHAGPFIKGNQLFYFDSFFNKYDSLYLDPTKLEELDGEIVETNNNQMLLASILIPLLLVLGGYLWKMKRKKNNGGKIHLKASPTTATPLFSTFNELETALLKCMLSKQKQGLHTTMEDINYILGVKDKSLGLQKKLRSDIINSINEKFRYFSNQQEGLVIGIRAKEDKRFVEYQLHPELLDSLQPLMRH